MAIKLGSVSDWRKLRAQEVLVLPGRADKARKVRLEVNCGTYTRFVLMRQGEEFFPLGVVVGHETIEFWCVGEVRVSGSCAEGGEVDAWFYTADGEATHFEPLDKKFVKIMTRRPRNLQLEWMEYQARINIDRRLEAGFAELERKFGARIDRKTGELIDEQNRKPAAGGGKGKAEAEPKPDAGGDAEAEGSGDGAPASAGSKPTGDGPAKRPKGDGGSPVPAPTKVE